MDTLFFIASKVIGALIRSETWIIVALGAIVLALILERRKIALLLSTTSFSIFVIIAIFPIGVLLLQPIERSFPANPSLLKLDGIIVLGGGEDTRASVYWGQIQLNEAGERYTAALALAYRFQEARLLFTGGSGALRDAAGVEISEADVAKHFFISHGIQPERLVLEGQSRNTAENAQLSYSLAAPASDETWALITSAFHMPRAIRSFETAGWTNLVPYPVDYRTASFVDGIGWNLIRNLSVLNIAIRESIGALAYRIFAR